MLVSLRLETINKLRNKRGEISKTNRHSQLSDFFGENNRNNSNSNVMKTTTSMTMPQSQLLASNKNNSNNKDSPSFVNAFLCNGVTISGLFSGLICISSFTAALPAAMVTAKSSTSTNDAFKRSSSVSTTSVLARNLASRFAFLLLRRCCAKGTRSAMGVTTGRNSPLLSLVSSSQDRVSLDDMVDVVDVDEDDVDEDGVEGRSAGTTRADNKQTNNASCCKYFCFYQRSSGSESMQ